MNQKLCNQDTVHYCSPAHGGWGIVRVGMLVPESYQLFVCPFACGRHGALGALQQGTKDRISYLFIDEADIVSGSYENLIEESIGQVLEAIEYVPKIIFIGVSCLDDLLGTDHTSLLERLKERYHIDFQVLHMNPITIGSKNPPPVCIQRNMYALIKGEAKSNGILNFIGNFIPVAPECELFDILNQLGIQKTKHISQFTSYEDFQTMGESQYNMVLRPEGLLAAKDMEENNKIEFCFTPVSYEIETIKEYYQLLRLMINPNINIDLSSYESSALNKINKTKELVGDTPISVDTSSVCKPYNLTKALINYGFNVVTIYADELPKHEENSYHWLLGNAPHLNIYPAQHHLMIKREKIKDSSEIAIGYNAGYMSGTDKVVDLVYDETMFGFHGICQLMDKIEEAYLNPKDLKTMIENYGLVV
ncbi:nitrogenase component 1 type oxidoreductase [Tissierella praeacuta]|uniref:nitrogenase component 1 n=1 Tax=Tissierella praeacuta TaxID=43131 RepID=UPI0010538152|nr:nitrogenase component 1 [Tissierella praeacuta]TCU77419.1 nitrogenase component 1 type oxidoreductase [Tissierella praeacuta]